MGRNLFLLLVSGLFFYVAYPLLFPILIGGVFAVLCFPIYERLLAHRCRPFIASLIVTSVMTVGVLLPLAALVFSAARSVVLQVGSWKILRSSRLEEEGGLSLVEEFFAQERVQSILEKISAYIPVESEELTRSGVEFLKLIIARIANELGQFVTSLPSVGMGLAVIVVSLFFFLVDGRKLVSFLERHSFFTPKQTARLVFSFGSMCRSVVLALVVSAVVQAGIFALACISTGVSGILIITFFVVLSSFIPLVGSTPVTFTVAIYHGVVGSVPVGVALFIVGLFVTILDNVIRPWIIKGAASLHPLIAFVAAFGGLQVMGLVGVFLGPIIAGIFVVTLMIVLEEK